MRLLMLATFLLIGSASQALNPRFIYPSEFNGGQMYSGYDNSVYGYANHRGYISIFNVDRTTLESLLPPEFGLAKVNGHENEGILIALWGEMSQTGAHDGVNIPSGIVYRELQFYIPGVYRRDGNHLNLRTYVPRMFVDAFLPEYLGRRFFYKKIQLDSIQFDISKGMEAGDWVSMKVSAPPADPIVRPDNVEWYSTRVYVADSDIMGENGPAEAPRCSGFIWNFKKPAKVSRANSSMIIHKKLVDGMSSKILDREIQSIATFRVENWWFYVDYYYNHCGSSKPD